MNEIEENDENDVEMKSNWNGKNQLRFPVERVLSEKIIEKVTSKTAF